MQAESPMRVFIGYDHRQPISYNVLSFSIVQHSSKPVSITPIVLKTIPFDRTGLTPFTYSRFLVPWMCHFKGWALFLDADMLVLDDIAELFQMANKRYAVLVSKNKMKFEWASAMLFNCGHQKNKILTPEYVGDAMQCKAPHMFCWLKDQDIGQFPGEWNHLVGYDPPKAEPVRLAHYTQGIPAFPETRQCELSKPWQATHQMMNSSIPWVQLMGNSVHAAFTDDGRLVPKLHPQASRPIE